MQAFCRIPIRGNSLEQFKLEQFKLSKNVTVKLHFKNWRKIYYNYIIMIVGSISEYFIKMKVIILVWNSKNT